MTRWSSRTLQPDQVCPGTLAADISVNESCHQYVVNNNTSDDWVQYFNVAVITDQRLSFRKFVVRNSEELFGNFKSSTSLV